MSTTSEDRNELLERLLSVARSPKRISRGRVCFLAPHQMKEHRFRKYLAGSQLVYLGVVVVRSLTNCKHEFDMKGSNWTLRGVPTFQLSNNGKAKLFFSQLS